MQPTISVYENGHFIPEKLSTNNFFHLEMKQGAKSKMYTLRRVPSPYHPTPGNVREQHITNLSTDKELAWEKAMNYANRVKMELYDDSVDKLRKIVRVSDGYVNFGKYEGTHVSEIDDNYLVWLADGGKVHYENNGEKSTKHLTPDELKPFVTDEVKKRGLFIEFEGKFISVKKRDYILSLRTGKGFHHNENETVELILKVEKVHEFPSQFGYNVSNYIISFIDEVSGNRYSYIGSIGRYAKGDTVHIKAKVNHKVYNNEEITYLKSIKDVPTEVYENFNKIKGGEVIVDVNQVEYTIDKPEDDEIKNKIIFAVSEFGCEFKFYKENFKTYGWSFKTENK